MTVIIFGEWCMFDQSLTYEEIQPIPQVIKKKDYMLFPSLSIWSVHVLFQNGFDSVASDIEWT